MSFASDTQRRYSDLAKDLWSNLTRKFDESPEGQTLKQIASEGWSSLPKDKQEEFIEENLDLVMGVSAPLKVTGQTGSIKLADKFKSVFHETSPDIGIRFPKGTGIMGLSGKFVSPDKSLALGQGKNTGVVLEIGTENLIGKPSFLKPGLRALKETQGKIGEFILENAEKPNIKSIIVKPTSKLSKLVVKTLKNKWVRGESFPDGSVRFFPRKEFF